MATVTRKKKDLAEVHKQFPSIDTLDWDKAMSKDFSLFTRVMADVIKSGFPSGKPGPRSAPDARMSLQQLLGNDFSLEPFDKAVRDLWSMTHEDEISVRKFAYLTGLERNIAHKLLSGRAEPDSYEMATIAQAFGRRPSYFLEYRVGYVLRFFQAFMVKYPESSIRSYLKTVDQVGKEQ